MDFRVGGREVARFRFKGGAPMGNDTVYLDIVPERRIVFAYTMLAGDTRISVSLATVEIMPVCAGTRLVYTEQGAFFEPTGAGRREYVVRTKAGTVRWSEGNRGLPRELPRTQLLALKLDRLLCRS